MKEDCYALYGYQFFQKDEIVHYYPFISGFYWYGADDCYECDSKELEKYFIKKFYKDAEERMHGLINTLSIAYFDTVRVYGEGFNTRIYNKGKCLDSLGNECEPGIQRCCFKSMQVHSSAADTSNRQVDSLTYWPNNSGIEPPCGPGCEDDCDILKRSVDAALGDCDMPCNEGPWIPTSEDSIDISHLLNGCPGFKIKIYYSYRNPVSPPCPKNYKDARYDSVSYIGPDSCISQLTAAEVSSFVNEWLLKRSALDNLAPLDCKEQFRLVNALCESDFDTVTKTGLGICLPLYNEQLGCCWGQYLVCRDADSTITFTKIDGTEFIGDTCMWFTRPCVPICEEVTNSLSADPDNPFGENSFDRLYLSMEKMNRGETLVISSAKNIINMKSKFISGDDIIIYDLFGKVVGDTKSIDKIYENYERGIYFIVDRDEGNVLKIIKILVEK